LLIDPCFASLLQFLSHLFPRFFLLSLLLLYFSFLWFFLAAAHTLISSLLVEMQQSLVAAKVRAWCGLG
jgi:hypothetical protein